MLDAKFVVEMSLLRNDDRSVTAKNFLLPVRPDLCFVGRTLALQKLQPFACEHMGVYIDHRHFNFLRRRRLDRAAEY